jgi:hypothetical protein
MARFYADIQGNRDAATRMGTKPSGMRGHIRGWKSGCKVYCYADEQDNDVCDVYSTSGSGGMKPDVLMFRTVNGNVTYLRKGEGE